MMNRNNIPPYEQRLQSVRGHAESVPLEIMECQSTLHPGSYAPFIYLQFDGTNIVQESPTVTANVYDANGTNCILPSEYAAVMWNYERRRYEVVGSQGLTRLATLAEDIASGASGNAVLKDRLNSGSSNISCWNYTSNNFDNGDLVIVVYYPSSGDGAGTQGRWVIASTSSGTGTPTTGRTLHRTVEGAGIQPAVWFPATQTLRASAAICDRYYFNVGLGTAEWVDSCQNDLVYNYSTVTIPGETFIMTQTHEGNLVAIPPIEIALRDYHYLTPTEGITRATKDGDNYTWGKGLCRRYTFDPITGLATPTETFSYIYNSMPTGIDGNTFVNTMLDQSDVRVVIVEPCADYYEDAGFTSAFSSGFGDGGNGYTSGFSNGFE